jgi:hypothetical protein
MKKLLLLVVLAAIVWFGYTRSQTSAPEISRSPPVGGSAQVAQPQGDLLRPPAQQFSCDGRTHCSQMRSCEEATYFIEHCPNTKMDGNNDGVPCERQWC